MKWEDFVDLTAHLPAIETELLLAGKPQGSALKVQVSRWVKAGRLIQLKRGIYVLAQRYRKTDIYEPYIASLLIRPSYISLEKALEFHGLIPEAVPVYTSVTTKRQGKFRNKLGVFVYRHVKRSLFWGYESVTVNNQVAFIASAEKALLDLFYLNGLKIPDGYIEELRLMNTEKIDLARLKEYAKRFGKPGMLVVAAALEGHIKSSGRG